MHCMPLLVLFKKSDVFLQSNHEHLFFQGEECLYLNTGDMVSETKGLMDGTGTTPANNGTVGHSTLVSNKQWIVIQV